MSELRILSPTAILGYGFPLASFQAGLERDPHVIAVDAGSTDPGPYYLGAGKSFTGRAPVKRPAVPIAAALNEDPSNYRHCGGSGEPNRMWTGMWR